jgi:hypothetical protein
VLILLCSIVTPRACACIRVSIKITRSVEIIENWLLYASNRLEMPTSVTNTAFLLAMLLPTAGMCSDHLHNLIMKLTRYCMHGYNKCIWYTYTLPLGLSLFCLLFYSAILKSYPIILLISNPTFIIILCISTQDYMHLHYTVWLVIFVGCWFSWLIGNHENFHPRKLMPAVVTW